MEMTKSHSTWPLSFNMNLAPGPIVELDHRALLEVLRRFTNCPGLAPANKDCVQTIFSKNLVKCFSRSFLELLSKLRFFDQNFLRRSKHRVSFKISPGWWWDVTSGMPSSSRYFCIFSCVLESKVSWCTSLDNFIKEALAFVVYTHHYWLMVTKPGLSRLWRSEPHWNNGWSGCIQAKDVWSPLHHCSCLQPILKWLHRRCCQQLKKILWEEAPRNSWKAVI